MTRYEELVVQQERAQAGGQGPAGYFRLLVETVSGGPSEQDPMGMGGSTTQQYHTLPGRIVWAGPVRPIRDSELGVIFRRAGVTICDVPQSCYSLLEPGRSLLVPEDSESGTSEVECRVIEVVRDDVQGTLVIYADKIIPSPRV